MTTSISRLSLVPAFAVMASLASPAFAQQAATPAELLEALRSQGVEIPEGFEANSDGTVRLPTEASDAPPPPPPAPDLWESQVTASLSLSDGNTEQLTARAGITSTREDTEGRLALDASIFYATDDGDETANEATIGALYDWYLGDDSPWLFFSEFRYNYDEFEQFLHRVGATVGPGYRLVEEEDLRVTLRAGAGVRRDFGTGAENAYIGEALVGGDLEWDITDRQVFTFSHRFFPSLRDRSDFRAVSTAGWDISMDDLAQGLSLNLGVEHEYETRVPEDIRESDIRIFAGLGIAF